MKFNYVFFSFLTLLFLSSCDFNINDSPGPQMSMSVREAQSHGTFICEYTVPDSSINGVKIKTIFAEKKFWRQEGVLLKKQINCCESQLVIVSTQSFSGGSSGYDVDWKLSGFESPSTYLVYRNFKSIIFRDSIPITIVVIKGRDSSQVIKRLTLHKVTVKNLHS